MDFKEAINVTSRIQQGTQVVFLFSQSRRCREKSSEEKKLWRRP
jgi:hypothetical protein